MNTKRSSDEFDRWSSIAATRKYQIDSYIDISFYDVFLPRYCKIFTEKQYGSVLDIGTGTGHLALHLLPFVKKMSAIEPSRGMYDVAKTVLSGERIELDHISSYDYLPKENFDCAYSHMCAHTVENVEAFFYSITTLLKPGGDFVFVIPHPCFYYQYKNYFAEEYDYMLEQGKDVGLSISLDKDNVMPNIPYFHRPLSRYFEALNNVGFVVENLIEEWPSENIMHRYPEPWKSPRYCFFMCKLLSR